MYVKLNSKRQMKIWSMKSSLLTSMKLMQTIHLKQVSLSETFTLNFLQLFLKSFCQIAFLFA
jgi:hypothetical protein